jgi:hypothetical protein
MKRSVFIIIGVVLVLILMAVWVYMLFFSTTANIEEPQYGDLEVGDTTDPNYQDTINEKAEESVVDVQSNQRLQQLTTRPVAGFIELSASTTTPREVFYMEVGTGHVYSIDLTTGAEDRISATTITGAQTAEFSKNGLYVMVQTGFSSQKEFLLGELNVASSTLTTTELYEPITSFSSTNDNQFLYSIQTNASTVGKIFNPTEFTSETLFTLPLRETIIEWGSDVTDSHYVYPKTTWQLENFAYQIQNGNATRMTVSGYGMSVQGNDHSVLYSVNNNQEYQSYIFNIKSKTAIKLPTAQIPEKCALGEGESPVTICANTEYQSTSLFPDSWYKGEVSSADRLWEISHDGKTAKFLIDTEQESGRKLDITQLEVTDNEAYVYFVNRADRTLWVYERITADVNQN